MLLLASIASVASISTTLTVSSFIGFSSLVCLLFLNRLIQHPRIIVLGLNLQLSGVWVDHLWNILLDAGVADYRSFLYLLLTSASVPAASTRLLTFLLAFLVHLSDVLNFSRLRAFFFVFLALSWDCLSLLLLFFSISLATSIRCLCFGYWLFFFFFSSIVSTPVAIVTHV